MNYERGCNLIVGPTAAMWVGRGMRPSHAIRSVLSIPFFDEDEERGAPKLV